MLYEQTGDVRSYFDGGKIRPLIFFYSHRLSIPQFADVPVSSELGYDVTLPQFRAIVVKAGTDPARVKLLADALAKVAQNRNSRPISSSNMPTRTAMWRWIKRGRSWIPG